MKKLLLSCALIIMPLNTHAMYITNCQISDITISGFGASFITINDAPWTHFINSDFFRYLLNNKIKILIVATAGIFLIRKIFFPTIESPTNTKKSSQNTIYDANEIETKEITFSGIDGIKGWGPGTVTITCNPEGEEKLTITADKNILAILEGYQDKSTLYFGPQDNVYFETYSPITYAILIKTLNSLSLDGSLQTTTNTINSDNLGITLNGSTTLEGRINTNNFTIHNNGSNAATLRGNTLHQKIKLDGDSTLDILGLISNSAEITMNGNTKAWIALQRVLINNNLQLTMHDNAQLHGTINVQLLDIHCTGCANALLTGNALTQKINLDDTSKLDASKLTGDTATISTNGCAKAWLSVQKTISYDINGASKIIYYGEPAKDGCKRGSAKIRPAGFYE